MIKHEEALARAMALCSRSEKSASDIDRLLMGWGIDSAETREKIVSQLRSEKFINDARYAGSFTRDKYRFNRWGRIKIRAMLRSKGIAENDIENALATIDPVEYENVLLEEISKKRKSTRTVNQWDLRGKLMRFATSRGYESDLVMRAIDRLTGGEEES